MSESGAPGHSSTPAGSVNSQAKTRQLLGTLANPHARVIFARLVLGDKLDEASAAVSAGKRAKAVAAVEGAGLVGEDSALDDSVFRELLAANAPVKKTGIDRFIEDGRILQYPSNLGERESVLEWAARRVIEPGETLSEAVLNERLRPIHDDVALLRRYLVDYGLVKRSADGSSYALPL